MKSRCYSLVALMLMLCALPSQATPLVDLGDNTFDPNTGLLWLDVTITANLSYNDVVANVIGAGNPYAGYRFATVAETTTLFTDAGIRSPEPQLLFPDYQNYLPLISLLGATFVEPGPITYTAGFNAEPPVAGFRPFTEVFIDFTHNTGRVGSIFDSINEDGRNPNIGSFLVEDSTPTATPLPAALPLFVSGLGVMGFFSWRGKRQAEAAA